MFSLQIIVKLVPFIIAHNSNIFFLISHRSYAYYAHIVSDCSVAVVSGQREE